MRYLLVPLFSILVFACGPGLAAAQELPSLLGIGLPSVGGAFGRGGWATHCDPKQGAGLDFWGAYLATNRAVVSELSSQDSLFGLLSISSILRRFNVQGPWVALSARGSLNEQVRLFARGSWLFASGRESDEQMGLLNPFSVDSAASTKPQWYTIDAGGLFSFSRASLVGGFRFDAFQTTFSRRREFTEGFGVGGWGSPGNYADLSVTSYIPYVGLMLQQGATMKVGFIGFPYVPGKVSYREAIGPFLSASLIQGLEFSGSFRSSYFLEAFAEYGTNVMGSNVGIFCIWTCLHAQSDVRAESHFVGNVNLYSRSTFDLTFDRQNWIFGGKFDINFTSPI